MSLLKLVGDATFYHVLERIDDDLATKAQAAGCGFCGGRLDVANYPRALRGVDDVGEEPLVRRSFCCAEEGCRRRCTPPSVRFLGRRVYAGAVVVLATALLHGPSKKSVTKLSALLGISRRTLVRWRRWWSTMFPTSRFWTSLRGRFVPAADEATMPASLLSRMTATDEPAVVTLLRLLAPMSTRPWLEASAS
ncbi:MAG: hypothetical protein HS111_10470 [Kofleriaceae bacterium]|nr:hypothetical protein [Kofleriaceae bacterium]